MNEHNIFIRGSIFLIRIIWHGKLGRIFNKTNKIKCRYVPSCSNYAILALEKYGFIKGWCMAVKRIRSCKRTVKFGTIDYPWLCM